MTITAIPPLDRTAPTFRADCDTYFATSIPNFTTEINALTLDLSGKQDTASKAVASVTESAKIATAKAGEAGTSAANAAASAKTASDNAAAAAASAATIGVTAAFSDANPIVKNAADNTKQGKFKADLISPGVTREYQMPDKNGRLALIDDTALVLLASVVPAASALTIDFLNIFSSAYDNYLIKIRTMEGSGTPGEHVRLRFAVAGIVDANSRYPWNSLDSGTGTGMQTDTSGRVLAALYNASMFGEINIFNANGTNTAKGWSANSSVNNSNSPGVNNSAGFYLGASAISGFRLFVPGGVYAKFLAKGSIEVYGYKKVM
ncbi:hypothetical protein F2P45_09695 [Massilia sp. CCM 8733]|uniref:Tail fiber protein n=1 Tax=Massilia mucilaginosa TaxID=2609282 RepID=A0ABX0NQW7_9BURK|nr:hypothetical protein [Massilia mucilaginosa]NHZ89283.1 hypothetical protein [Massilia mucilaginosa]